MLRVVQLLRSTSLNVTNLESFIIFCVHKNFLKFVVTYESKSKFYLTAFLASKRQKMIPDVARHNSTVGRVERLMGFC